MFVGNIIAYWLTYVRQVCNHFDSGELAAPFELYTPLAFPCFLISI